MDMAAGGRKAAAAALPPPLAARSPASTGARHSLWYRCPQAAATTPLHRASMQMGQDSGTTHLRGEAMAGGAA